MNVRPTPRLISSILAYSLVAYHFVVVASAQVPTYQSNNVNPQYVRPTITANMQGPVSVSAAEQPRVVWQIRTLGDAKSRQLDEAAAIQLFDSITVVPAIDSFEGQRFTSRPRFSPIPTRWHHDAFGLIPTRWNSRDILVGQNTDKTYGR